MRELETHGNNDNVMVKALDTANPRFRFYKIRQQIHYTVRLPSCTCHKFVVKRLSFFPRTISFISQNKKILTKKKIKIILTRVLTFSREQEVFSLKKKKILTRLLSFWKSSEQCHFPYMLMTK